MEEKKETKPKATNLRYLRDKDREMVRGMFKFYEVPGGRLEFVYKKYKEDKTERYDFVDGNIYTIPLGVAKHIANDCTYPVHAHAVDADGKPIQKISQKVSRCGFQSLEFVDIDDFKPSPSGIITVENI